MDFNTILWTGAGLVAIGFTAWLFWPSKRVDPQYDYEDSFYHDEDDTAKKLAAIDYGAETAKVAVLENSDRAAAKLAVVKKAYSNKSGGTKKAGKKLVKQVKAGAKGKKAKK